MSMGCLATVSLESTSPYSCSRMHGVAKLAKESHDAYDQRTWRDKAHYNSDGKVIIPRMSIKFSLVGGAAYLGERVQGKNMKTWTQYFTSAIHIMDDIVLPQKREDVQSITLYCHANGNRRSGKRVARTFPLILSWAATVQINVLDETITEDIFGRVLEHAGAFIGIGRFRPENGGYNGRYVVRKISWKKLGQAA